MIRTDFQVIAHILHDNMLDNGLIAQIAQDKIIFGSLCYTSA